MSASHLFHYVDASGTDVFQQWLDRLADLRCRIAILRRVDRLALGNAGDHKFCRDGVWELRVDCGPGYRVYYCKIRQGELLILGAGRKRTQRVDIEDAIERRQRFEVSG